MWHIIHRLGAVFAVVLIGLVVLGHSPTLQVALGEELQMKPPSKIAHIVEQVVSRCYEARRSQDLSALSNAVLHVTPSGKEGVVQLWIWYPLGKRRTIYFCRGNYGYTCAPLSVL